MQSYCKNVSNVRCWRMGAMSDTYGVSFGRQNYNGRDEHGELKLTAPYAPSDGRLMNRETADQLCRILKLNYPQVRVIQIFRGEQGALTAESLAEVGDATPLDVLVEAVKDCIRFGNTPDEILTAVNKA